MHRPPWAPAEVDITRPSEARIYDFYLGGSNNFASDREFAQTALASCPDLDVVIRDNRSFLVRVVRHLTAAGIDQFLDLGSGILTTGSVHEVAQAANPAARVVCVDIDPVAVAYGRALLAGHPRAHMVAADLREHDRVLAEAAGPGGLDLGRPVGLLAVGVLHFIPDDQRPAAVMASYLRALCPGSYLAISHVVAAARGDTVPGHELFVREPTLLPLSARVGTDIDALFGDLTLVPPGLVPIRAWQPCPADPRASGGNRAMLAGLGRRD